MPILQYRCPKCGKEFDELVSNYKDNVLCPDCREKAERNYSGCIYSATGKPPIKCNGDCSKCSGC